MSGVGVLGVKYEPHTVADKLRRLSRFMPEDVKLSSGSSLSLTMFDLTSIIGDTDENFVMHE